MKRLDKILAGAALALFAASMTVACAGRVRPGVGFSNDGQRVAMDLGEYDTTVAHPVTGTAPTCTGPECGIPDPVVPVRASQIRAAQEAAKTPPWVYPLLVVGALGVVVGAVFVVRGWKR